MADETTEAPEATEAPPEAASAPPTTPSDGPWASDLASAFADESQRAAVDEFLRKTVQPHITQLEQASVESRDANRLWNDFAERPVETYAAVSRELLGDELADKILAVITSEDEGDDEAPVTETSSDADESPSLDPRVAALVEKAEQAEREQAFAEELARVREDNPDVEIDEELFYPFVVSADGDFDVAASAYKAHVERSREKFGISLPDQPDDAPPPVIGSSHQQTAPPQKKEYTNLDEAMDDFFAEQNAAPQVTGA